MTTTASSLSYFYSFYTGEKLQLVRRVTVLSCTSCASRRYCTSWVTALFPALLCHLQQLTISWYPSNGGPERGRCSPCLGSLALSQNLSFLSFLSCKTSSPSLSPRTRSRTARLSLCVPQNSDIRKRLKMKQSVQSFSITLAFIKIDLFAKQNAGQFLNPPLCTSTTTKAPSQCCIYCNHVVLFLKSSFQDDEWGNIQLKNVSCSDVFGQQ